MRLLRQVEGELRGLGREMSQQEVARAIADETRGSFSQSYLSQVESGTRPHLTHGTRELLARFFRVHPGYLVTDPPGYHTELVSNLSADDEPLDEWLRQGADRFSGDRELVDALLKVAANNDSRKCLVLLGAILDVPALVDRLLAALAPTTA